MIDSIKLGFHCYLTSKQLEEWTMMTSTQYKPTSKISTKFQTWIKFPYGSIHVKYYPQDRNNRPEPLLLFEMSLPKLVYGNNIQMIDSPSLAIQKAQEIIGQYFYIPSVDLTMGTLYRLDLCYNFQVGEQVSEWIRQLFKLEYPRRKTKPYYPTEGVQYYSKRASLSFYNKEDETKDPTAHGILRMEASWRDKNQIGKLVNKPLATIGDFSSDVTVVLLNKELDRLGVNGQSPDDPTAALRILLKKKGLKWGFHLFGHLHARQIASRKVLIKMGVSRQIISRSQKKIKAAGLSMSIAENGVVLPKLVIDPKSIMGRDKTPMIYIGNGLDH